MNTSAALEAVEKKRNIFPLPGIEPKFFCHAARSPSLSDFHKLREQMMLTGR
jgi:hypothetical protein